jgi:hypothetical protein
MLEVKGNHHIIEAAPKSRHTKSKTLMDRRRETESSNKSDDFISKSLLHLKQIQDLKKQSMYMKNMKKKTDELLQVDTLGKPLTSWTRNLKSVNGNTTKQTSKSFEKIISNN